MSDEIQRALGRVEGKLDSLIATMKDHLADDSRNFAEVNARIGRVERKVYWFPGAWAAVGAAVAAMFRH